MEYGSIHNSTHIFGSTGMAIEELFTSYFENSWEKGNSEFLKTNPIKNLHMLWKYLHHLVRETQESSIPGNPFTILLSDQFCILTWKEFMTWRLQDSNQNTSSVSYTDIKDNPSKTPGMTPIRMLINTLPSRRASREKCHNTPSSRKKVF